MQDAAFPKGTAARRCCKSLSSPKVLPAHSLPSRRSKRTDSVRRGAEQFLKPRQERVVGHVELKRRHRDAAMIERREISAVGCRSERLAHVGDPVIGIAAA